MSCFDLLRTLKPALRRPASSSTDCHQARQTAVTRPKSQSMRWFFIVLAFSVSATAWAAGKNVAMVGTDTYAFNEDTKLPIDPVWVRTFTKTDAERAFRAGMSRYTMTSLKCSVAATGHLKNCRRERAPDAAALNSYYEVIEQSFVLSPSMFKSVRPEALTVWVNVETANSAGVGGPPYPCLPAFCTATPPPPPPPNYRPEGCKRQTPLSLEMF